MIAWQKATVIRQMYRFIFILTSVLRIFLNRKTMAQEDDLRALGKIMDFLRAVSIILAIMNVYWYCYEAMHMWGVTIGVVDRILINFNRTGGKYFISQ